MKKHLLAIACLIATWQNVVAQEIPFPQRPTPLPLPTTDFARLYVGAIEPQYSRYMWLNSPYYNDSTNLFQGRVSYYGVTYDNVPMRFDQYRQHLVVLSPVSNYYCLPDPQHIDWFQMDGRTFTHDPYDPSRFAHLLCDGQKNGVRLYHCVWKVYGGEKLQQGKQLQKTFNTNEHYTLQTPDGKSHLVKGLSDVVRIFPEQKKRIKQFARKNHLSFSRQRREESLAKLVESLSPTPLTPTPQTPTPSPSRGEGSLITPTINNATSNANQTPLPSGGAGGGCPGGGSLITGIPVLDDDSLATTFSSEPVMTSVVPGVRKAKASIADDHELAEILVVGGRQSAVRNLMMGAEKFKPQLLKNIPMALGEADIMKLVLTLPGVTTVGEASSGYNVRGGATDQNLILFNGGTMYNPSHLFGLFTVINPDAVEDVELFKSSIPAEYGGRISSVLKVTSKEANMRKFTGSASLGLLTSKASLEIPIVKNHVSLLLNGRTTYSDWMLKKLPEKSGYKNGTANFNDLGGVLTCKFNDNHRLKLFAHWSNDRFSFSSEDDYGYQNRNLSAEWRSILNEKLTATITAGYDHYDYFNEERRVPTMAARLSFGIDQLWAKLHLRQRLGEKQTLSYGLSVQHYDVQGGKYEPVGDGSFIKSDQLQKEKALESAAYIDYERSLTEKLSVAAGLRYSVFNALGPRDVNVYADSELPSEATLLETRHETGIFKTYHAPEFRLSARYALQENFSLKAGFNTMHQYLHKVSNTTIMSPTDIWKLSDFNIKPQNGWQAAAGIYYETTDKQYEFSAEVYYKHINDYLNYRSSAVLLMNPHLETDVISTRGKAYGLELQVKKPTGKINGWASYTFSRALLRQDDKRVALPLNNGDWYPAEYDRPHELKAVLNYKFTERYSLSSYFNYATGRPTTVPAGMYYDTASQRYLPYYTDRNKYRIPDYMRLDLAFNIEPTHKLTSFLHTMFSIGVYNALARRNAYNIYYVSEGFGVQGYKLSVFGTAIPYASINIRFN